jgi:hypothetical protein
MAFAISRHGLSATIVVPAGILRLKFQENAPIDGTALIDCGRLSDAFAPKSAANFAMVFSS